MTQAISARRDGDGFQARVFWLKAAVLLDPNGHIRRVGFESGPKGFDDIWVEYDPRNLPRDPYGEPLDVERLQCKWHVGLGHYTHVDLTRPEYIGATSASLLQRAQAAATSDRAAGLRSRVKLVTNHRVDPDDVLHGLIRNRSHSLNVEDLFAGKTEKSASGAMRKLWREHLGIDEHQLRILAHALGFSSVLDSLDGLRDQLDVVCKAYGLRRIPVNSSTVDYDDIIRQWAAQNRLVFDRKSFREACEREGLLAGSVSPNIVFGVKSFEHAFDRLEDRCMEVLDLIPEFDDRFIRDSAAWRGTLLPEMKAFLTRAARTSGAGRLRLALDAHTTLAFAAGTVLNIKSGRVVEIEQRSGERVVWAPDDRPLDDTWPKWDNVQLINIGGGPDIAVGVSLAQEVEPKMREYAAAHLGSVGRLVVARPTGGTSQKSILCGAHADRLAEELARRIKALREAVPGAALPRVHLFIAAPNGFTFYLGRHVDSLQPLTLYEFDFQSQRDRSYHPSLSVPEVEQARQATNAS